ncbi:MAG: PRC-barrel domain-containing protein [Phycisphaerales bacterium]
MQRVQQNIGERHPARTAEMRGTKVTNPEGEDLGKITDLVVDSKTGHMPYAVVSFGGVLGIGRESVAVPMEAFGKDGRKDRFVLSTSREQLEQAPDFDPNNWNNLHDDSWRDKISKAFGKTPEHHGGAGANAGSRYMLSTDLEGASIVDAQGKDTGTINELIADRSSCDIGFVLMKSGGVAGIGADSIPVPWKALSQTEGTKFRISVPNGRIEDAPKLEKDQVDQLGRPEFCDSVCDFFGVHSGAAGGRQSGTSAGSQSNFGTSQRP